MISLRTSKSLGSRSTQCTTLFPLDPYQKEALRDQMTLPYRTESIENGCTIDPWTRLRREIGQTLECGGRGFGRRFSPQLTLCSPACGLRKATFVQRPDRQGGSKVWIETSTIIIIRHATFPSQEHFTCFGILDPAQPSIIRLSLSRRETLPAQHRLLSYRTAHVEYTVNPISPSLSCLARDPDDLS